MIIARLNRINISESDFDYFRKCEILIQNPVLTARHFQFRVETFFKEIILHKYSPLNSVTNYVIKVEFQFRGSPHVHSFILLKDLPILSDETKQKYINFVDSIIRADLPDETNEPELFKLVNQYQIHAHSKSCRKYKNVPCRLHYGRFFTKKTIIAEPLTNEMSDNVKVKILPERALKLNKVKEYIDENLNPLNPNFKGNYSIPDILMFIGLTEEESVLSCTFYFYRSRL